MLEAAWFERCLCAKLHASYVYQAIRHTALKEMSIRKYISAAMRAAGLIRIMQGAVTYSTI